jgi:NADH:ubiquinone oxidoreductase subunit F (NADH-binding)/NADH:ubiquinone oxidoreductase subunit E
VELLRKMMRLQHERGCLTDETLREISKQRRVPLYRLEELVSFYPSFHRTPPPKFAVHVCRDVACAMRGCGAQSVASSRAFTPRSGEPHLTLAEQIRDAVADGDDVEVCEVSCLGRCEHAPAIEINEVPLSEANSLSDIEAFLSGENPLPENEPTSTPRTWKCDPYSVPSSPGGGEGAVRGPEDCYSTVRNLAADTISLAETCIERLSAAGLRGMGGAGFPTGRKWELVRGETEPTKYVICNADESEPGTFKDRVILEELPHLVIEGMVLAGLTIGAERGIVYIRHEYQREQKALEEALEEARRRGILGEDAAASGRRFDIEIFVSPGGYILGEETALLEALEDKRGEPRNKPPYPGTHGLWGKPTLINNVETYALATSIVNRGADWWAEQGRGEVPGLKFVSVSGDVVSPGVYEIPLGMPVSELIELAGGLPDGQQLQAFLPGGASSNFLPASAVDTPLDFDSMKAAGSMLGTGAVIVISDRHILFDLATNIVTFFRNESCGKCVPCRMGSQQAVSILEAVQTGSAGLETLDILPELGETLEQTSICGLGQVALNPILSLMKNISGAVEG